MAPKLFLHLQCCPSPIHSPFSSLFIQTIFLSMRAEIFSNMKILLANPICPWFHVFPCIHQVSAQLATASLKFLLQPPLASRKHPSSTSTRTKSWCLPQQPPHFASLPAFCPKPGLWAPRELNWVLV